MRLFGEYCLLLEEDWNDFVARHSPVRLRQLHKQLAAVGLWPAEIQAPVRGTGLLSAVTGLLSGIKMPPEEAPEPPPEPPPAPTRGPDTAAQAAAGRDPEQVLQSLVAPALGIELHPALYHHAEVAAEAGPLQDAIGLLRYRLAQELGFVLPLVHMHENVEMSEHTYAIRIAGETIAEGRLQPDRLAAL
ncbi:MAG: FHIPEP family type III secretion protein, partial [Candidatus Sericytochromatia bacterium]